MNDREPQARIDDGRRALKALGDSLSWITVGENSPDDTDESGRAGHSVRWSIGIEGKGLASGGPEPHEYKLTEHHEIELCLEAGKAAAAPCIRFVTPVFHPNIAPDGLVSLTDIGLAWRDDLPLDVIVERVWDTIRCAWMDLDNAIHGAAARWFAAQTALELPLDARTLSGQQALSNVVRYRHRRRRRKYLERPAPESVGRISGRDEAGIHFID